MKKLPIILTSSLACSFLLIMGITAQSCSQSNQIENVKDKIIIPTIIPRHTSKNTATLFTDDFEKSTKFLDLFQADFSRFTHFEKTQESNKVLIGDTQPFSGKYCLSLSAEKSRGNVSKAALEKEGFDLREGQKVKLSARILIPGNSSLDNLFLFDLECISCWPKSKKSNPHMGIRLMLKDKEGYIAVERGKIGYRKGTFYQKNNSLVAFPRNKWVKLDWVLALSPEKNGFTEVFIDDKQVLSAQGINMPNAEHLYQKHGLKINTPVRYDKFEFGITANGFESQTTMLVDDISVTLVK